MKISSWIKLAKKKLIHIENSRLDIEILLSFVIKKSISWIIGFDDYQLSWIEIQKLKKLLEKRAVGKPIAYLLGYQEFWSLTLKVSSKTFIPRPDTEKLVEICLSKLNVYNQSKILDLGTGSGAVALSIADASNNYFVTGTDCCKKALFIAKYNSKKLNIKNVDFIFSNWFSSLQSCMFNIIVSNPPYISYNEFLVLKETLKYEPKISLVSNYDGLGDIKYIISVSMNYLYNHGWLLIEHGWNQGSQVKELFIKHNFININTYKDYGGNDRVTVGQKKI